MEKSKLIGKLISKYELMLILNAKLTSEERDSVCKEVVTAIGKEGGNVINSKVYLEKHKMTFPIKKCQDGAYYLFNFEGEGPTAEKIRPILKLNDKVLRFSVITV